MPRLEPTFSSNISSVDLHCHSTASDGFLTPHDLVQKALSSGLRVIALTDHDSTAGHLEADAATVDSDIEVIPGIELSSNLESDEFHLLGYFVDRANAHLIAHLKWCQEKRVARIQQMCQKMAQLGLPVTYEDVMTHAGPGSVGRPHVALVLIQLGLVSSIGEAFDKYLGVGRPGYVPRENVDPFSAISVIRQAGGVAVLAHPFSVGEYRLHLPALVDSGLQGLESYYGEYHQNARERLAADARRFDLIATGGSDYHGDGFKEGRGIGSVYVPPTVVEELRAAAGT
ncbi:PHP domain-containing protein [soil metagenome]